MNKSQPCTWLEKPFEGYVVNAVFSEANSRLITDILNDLTGGFPGVIYPMTQRSLHVTLFDWIAPLFEYGGHDKRELFETIRSDYDQKLKKILSTQSPIDVVFEQIKVTPSTIIVIGKDNGSFQTIRDGFVDAADLLPDTKLPPTIIHSSIARFTGETELEPIQAFLDSYKVRFTETFKEFRLVHTKKEPMLDFEVLETYRLNV